MKTPLFPLTLLLGLLLVGALHSCSKQDDFGDLPGEPYVPGDSIFLDLCEDSIDLPEISLLPESVASFPYQTVNKIVFRNEAGQLRTFLNDFRPHNIGSIRRISCNANSHEKIHYYYRRNRIYSTFLNDTLNIEFVYEFSPSYQLQLNNLDPPIYDALYVQMNNPAAFTPSRYGRLLVAQRNLPADIISDSYYFPQVELLGETFRDVYTTNDEGSVVFFTQEQGIIAFHDWHGKIWRLEYVE